ncbi:MAG TPA: thioesterase family protein [Myxococcota bacterium]|jgi:acyl-CoA thioester hydrolase|nr:thioesterase family protein [Myxococcota bacterium]
MGDAVFRVRRTIGEREIDELGHVNNVVWLRMAMKLCGEHAVALGLSHAELVATGGLFVVSRHEIDYLRAAFPGEEVIGETWVSEMHGARSTRHVRFSRAEDGAALVRLRSEWAYVDVARQRPKRIPPAVLERFALLAEPPPPSGAGAR